MSSLYLHIPFCEHKCLYCDFYSVENRSTMDAFVRSLCLDIAAGGRWLSTEPLETLFLGGGTPSLLAPAALEGILSAVHDVAACTEDAEVTMEVNPGTVTRSALASYRSAGINRLSIGVQSFDADELRFLERIHGSREAVDCVATARAAGFENIGIDLIFGLPGQTSDRWQATLKRALDLSPDHVSAYGLTVEENTPLARQVALGLVTPASTEVEAELYELTMDMLGAAGYEHYEVSNYARPGYSCRHNVAYWSHRNYLGCGPSAHSFWMEPDGETGRRWWTIANVGAYCEGITAGTNVTAGSETLGPQQLAVERVFLELRTGGVRATTLAALAGGTPSDESLGIAEGLVAGGLAVRSATGLRLTPRGFLLCDEIARRFLTASRPGAG